MLSRSLVALVVLVLLAGCTGGPVDDGDRDGIKDSVEGSGRAITIERLGGPDMRTVTSDPGKADTDGDGLLDGDEMLARGTDPRSVDTDGDGLLDGHDTRAEGDAAQAWRKLGLLELNGTFLGELDACPEGEPQLRGNVESSDLPVPDGLGDGEELRGWDIVVHGSPRHVVSDPCIPDTDGDTLRDHDEKILLTDPRSRDTDDDGAPDGADADPLHDLGLAFSNLTVESNRSAVRVVLSVASGTASLTWPGNATAVLDVPDMSPSRESLEITVIVTAEELSTGERVELFEDPRGALVVFDVVKGTVSGLPMGDDARLLRFSGADGSATLRWETTRK